MADTLSLKQALYRFFCGIVDTTISDEKLTGELIKLKLGYDPVQMSDIENSITVHSVSETAHNDIRELINGIQSRLNAFFDTDDKTLDQMSELIGFLKSNKTLIEGITTSKVNVDDIVDNLASTSSVKPLSANQGRVINELIDTLRNVVAGKAEASAIPLIPENLSSFKNDVGYLTEHQSLEGKVDKISGKELSSNDYTDDEKTKLSGIEVGADANVQADWNQTNPSEDSYIKNKPAALPASDVYDWAKAETKPSYTAGEVGADPFGTASSAIQGHNSSEVAHDDIRRLITDLTNRLNAFLDSDDKTLDQASEIVAYIKANRELIDSITTSKVNVSDIINNLTSTAANKPLSANQGKALKALIDNLTTTVNGKATSAQGAKADSAVQAIQIGGTAQSKTNGTVNLPAYPTTLPANGGNAATVGGHTVLSNVPANAKFTDTNTTYTNMAAATASAAGKAGLVPAPAAGAQGKYLRGDGTWQTPPNTTYGNASATAAGLVSTGAQTFAGNKTFNGTVACNGASAIATAQARNIYAGTADLTAGSSALASGTIYIVYE